MKRAGTWKRIERVRMAGLGALVAVAATAGCMGADVTGQTRLPLTTIGPDGASYRMPAGTVLRITSDVFAEELPMDADETVATLTLPVGDYQATLSHEAGYTTSWPLVRATPDGESVVGGELLTAMPLAFSVAEGQTTELALVLRVTRVGDVVFANGELDASLSVDTVDGAAARAGVVGHYQPEGTVFDPAWPELESMLGFGIDASLPFLIDARLEAPFTQTSSTTACAQVSAEFTAGELHAGWEELMFEIAGGAGALCITGDQLNLFLIRDGASQSGLVSGLGAGVYSFSINVRGVLPVSVFDGENLSLSALDDQVELGGAFVDVVIDAAGGEGRPLQTSGGAIASLRLFP